MDGMISILSLRLSNALLDIHAARCVAYRLRLETIRRPVEQLGHTALRDVLAIVAAVTMMWLCRHVIVPADDAFEVAIDDRISVVAEDVIRHQRHFPAAARRIHDELRDGEAGSMATQEFDDFDTFA